MRAVLRKPVFYENILPAASTWQMSVLYVYMDLKNTKLSEIGFKSRYNNQHITDAILPAC